MRDGFIKVAAVTPKVVVADPVENTIRIKAAVMEAAASSEAHRHYAFIHFNTVGKIHRDIVQPERASDTFLRNTVDKHLYVFPAEAVQHELHVRTYPARLAQFHARRFALPDIPVSIYFYRRLY